MPTNEMKSAVSNYILAKGIIDPAEVEAEVAKLAAACPEATAAEKGATDNYAKAYWTIQIQAGNSDKPAPTQTEPATAMPADSVSAEESRIIVEGLAQDKAQRNFKSTDTVIETLVVDKPAPSEMIKPGTKGVINKKSWDAIEQKYAGKVLPDDADPDIKSTTNFNLLKAAAEKGELVDVMIGAQSKRPVAVEVQIPQAQGQGKTSKVMNLEGFENFVVLETAGFVLATDTTAGAKLRYVKPSKDKKNPGVIKPSRVVLAFTNRSNANIVASREVTSEVKEDAACKSALCFKVDTGRKKADGTTPIYQTIRVTVNAPVALTERKAKYVDALGTVGKAKGSSDLLTAPDSKAMKQINKAQVAKIAELRQKAASGDYDTIATYGDALKAFGSASPAASASVGL